MNYTQEYIRDEYLELKMPAGMDRDGEPTFLLDPNHLHIWPRHSFMLIALPNKVRALCVATFPSSEQFIPKDKTFTCTVFAPAEEFDRLRTPDSVICWFKSNFPDALHAIGEKSLVEDFLSNPRSPLICTKVKIILLHTRNASDCNHPYVFPVR
jgi:kynurenine 3-monooxygenase